MAAPLGFGAVASASYKHLNLRQPFNLLSALLPTSITACHASTYGSTKQRINVRRTKADIARALRPKQNFLHPDAVDKHRHSLLQKGTHIVSEKSDMKAPRDYKFVMPEFMPNPRWEYRDRVLEKLQRQDMLRRRKIINIPEFYVGSIMAVSVSDPHAPGKLNRFVGICISRQGHGLDATFILRNVVDGLGVEVKYEMYNPTLHSIEVLKLEKWLDDELFYLRNASAEHSTFSFDMEPVPLPRGADVPVNTLKVKLNPRPWEQRWERMDLKGILPIEMRPKLTKGKEKTATPWTKHDLMLHYRSEVNEEEAEQIMDEVYTEKKAIDAVHQSSKTVLKKRRK